MKNEDKNIYLLIGRAIVHDTNLESDPFIVCAYEDSNEAEFQKEKHNRQNKECKINFYIQPCSLISRDIK